MIIGRIVQTIIYVYHDDCRVARHPYTRYYYFNIITGRPCCELYYCNDAVVVANNNNDNRSRVRTTVASIVQVILLYFCAHAHRRRVRMVSLYIIIT